MTKTTAKTTREPIAPTPKTTTQKVLDLIAESIEMDLRQYGQDSEPVALFDFNNRLKESGVISTMEWASADLVERAVRARMTQRMLRAYCSMLCDGKNVMVAAGDINGFFMEEFMRAASESTSTSDGHNLVRNITTKVLAEMARGWTGGAMVKLAERLDRIFEEADPTPAGINYFSLREEEIVALDLRGLAAERPMNEDELADAKRRGSESTTVSEFGWRFEQASDKALEAAKKRHAEKAKR